MLGVRRFYTLSLGLTHAGHMGFQIKYYRIQFSIQELCVYIVNLSPLITKKDRDETACKHFRETVQKTGKASRVLH